MGLNFRLATLLITDHGIKFRSKKVAKGIKNKRGNV